MEVVRKSSGNLTTISEAVALLDNHTGNQRAVLTHTGVLDYHDVEGTGYGSFPGGRLFESIPLLSGGAADPQFAVRCTGLLTVPPAASPNAFTFAVGSDDGFSLKIHDGTMDRTAEHPGLRGIGLGPLLTVTFPAAGGQFPCELVYFEGGGGAILELSYAAGSHASFASGLFQLLDAAQALRQPLAPGLDQDGDGLTNGAEVSTYGTDPYDPDTDHDGLSDGLEVDMWLPGTTCPSPVDPDSDHDGINDGAEVAAGTNTCALDTDGDGLLDGIDGQPLVNNTSCTALEAAARLTADYIDSLPLAVFVAQNESSSKGQRNSLASRCRLAANRLSECNAAAASALLTSALERAGGAGPAWVVDGPPRQLLASMLVAILSLLPQ